MHASTALSEYACSKVIKRWSDISQIQPVNSRKLNQNSGSKYETRKNKNGFFTFIYKKIQWFAVVSQSASRLIEGSKTIHWKNNNQKCKVLKVHQAIIIVTGTCVSSYAKELWQLHNYYYLKRKKSHKNLENSWETKKLIIIKLTGCYDIKLQYCFILNNCF